MSEILKDPRNEAEAPRRASAPLGELERVRPLFLAAGLMLLVAGWLDIALLWYPPRLGEADWEFGIIAQSLDAMPLPTMGLLLTATALLLGRARWAVWLAFAAFVVVALWLLAMGVLFALDVPQALAAVARDARLGPGVKRVLLKAVVFLASYTAGYAAAAVLLWRRARRMPPA